MLVRCCREGLPGLRHVCAQAMFDCVFASRPGRPLARRPPRTVGALRPLARRHPPAHPRRARAAGAEQQTACRERLPRAWPGRRGPCLEPVAPLRLKSSASSRGKVRRVRFCLCLETRPRRLGERRCNDCGVRVQRHRTIARPSGDHLRAVGSCEVEGGLARHCPVQHRCRLDLQKYSTVVVAASTAQCLKE